MTNTRSRPSGFTLVEAMVVVAIIGVLAVLMVAGTRWAARNASVEGAMGDLVVRLNGLPGFALSDGSDRVLVVLDRKASSNDPVRTFVLTAPTSSWTLASFDPANPGLAVRAYDEVRLPDRAALLGKTSTPAPAPLQNVNFYDSRALGTCGGVPCFAIRFTADGEAWAEAPGGGLSAAPGFGFVIGDHDDPGSTAAAHRRAIVLGFPTGIVKSYVQ